MSRLFAGIGDFMRGDREADRVVPQSGFSAQLTSFVAAAMAFLSVFTLAMAIATERLADRWSAELARTATVRISAPEGQQQEQANIVIQLLKDTKGVQSARMMTEEEQRRLLDPWFGPDLPLDQLPIPKLIEVIEEEVGPDMAGLRLRLQAEAPGAILDDHSRWRQPLVSAADRLRLISSFSLVLILCATIAMIILAVQSSLAANGQVIEVLRLVGAKDNYIAKAFVRRYTIRAFFGAILGTAVGMGIIAMLPAPAEEGAFLTNLGFQSFEWGLPVLIPVITLVVAFWATRRAAFAKLSESS